MFKLIFSLFVVCFLAIVYSENSFTIVIDTTKSMNLELDNIKVALPQAVNQINYNFDNYIIVPFNYPGVLNHIIVNKKEDLASSLSGVIARGGQECPENVLESIERALRISKNGSDIFVFTDAYPRDDYKLPSVENLCRITRSKVTVFLSGFCSQKPEYPSVSPRAYYDIARACSGAVLLTDASTLRQAHTIIKEVTKKDWTEIYVFDTVDNYKQFSFTVDVFTKQALLIVSGKDLNVQISAGQGSNHGIEKTFHTKDIEVYHMTPSSKEEFTVTVRCRSKISATLYKQHYLPIDIGFSSMSPRSMLETSKRPIPGRTDYILLDVSQMNIKLESVDIELIGSSKTRLALEERPDSLYLTQAFIDPLKGFRLWIRGYQLAYPNEEVSESSEVIYPQETVNDVQWISPSSTILDPQSITVYFMKNIIFACKVTGYPKPTIWWEDDSGTPVPSQDSLLEIPYAHISYATVTNVTQNSTISCKAKNSQGEGTSDLNIYVYRPFFFNILQTPLDTTIYYGSDDKLYCEASAYPEPEIKWYHNDTEITGFGETEILTDENALLIKNMTLDDVGVYKCEISNSVNTTSYSVAVNIAGIELPAVNVENTSVTLKLGEQSTIECRVVNGKPSPDILWKYKSAEGDDFDSLPEGVEVDEGKLKFTQAQNIHKGFYKCTASNFLGEDSVEITINLQYPPIIKDPETDMVTVKEGNEVTLPCVVDADPAPQVRWEMTQGDVIMTLGPHHVTDHENTHRFTALWNDTGNYHCIAENALGRDEKTISVNVLVKPFIDPKPENITVPVGERAVITCNVTFGNPMPTTTLEFMALDSTTTVLSRRLSSITYVIANVNHANEGVYRCIAENSVGTDNIKINMKIM